MFSKTLLIVVIVNLISDYSYGQKHKRFFRRDYSYVEEPNSFFKFHTIQKSWLDAKRTCVLEGATLYHPDDDYEAHAVIIFWNNTQPYPTVYVGLSDLLAKGVYETVDGRLAADVYNIWSAGEPNNEYDREHCATMLRDGTMNDVPCDYKFPFICKKSIESLEWNRQCNFPNLDYEFNKESGSCYKFHTTPLSWPDAYTVCSAEQSYLAVINSQSEADYLAKLTETKTKDKPTKDNQSGAILLGFHNRLDDGWRSVRGTTLNDTGYVQWGQTQRGGDAREKCGSMYYNGLLSDINCTTKSYFICEHEVEK